MPSMSLSKHRLSWFHRRLLTAVLHVVEHPRRTLLISGIILLLCGGLAWRKLDISTDQDQLFSSNVPFFRNYIEFTQDFPENQANYVIVEPKDPVHPPPVGRWTDVADAITDRLRSERRFVKTVDSHIPLEDLGAQSLLFEDSARLRQDVTDASRIVPLARLWGESPTVVTRLLGKSPLERFLTGAGIQPIDTDTASFVNLVAAGWNKAIADPHKPITVDDQVPDLATLSASDPGSLGYYYVKDEQDANNHLLLVRVYENTDYSSMGGMAETINGIRAAARDAARPFPEFNVALTGRPALEADEMLTTDRDSRRSEIVALIAVFIGLVVLLRSAWLAIAAEVSLLVGIGWTFGWATISVGELNLLSMVFLIALIGIGMDYLIQVLTRYRREAAKHTDPRVIWIAVFKYVAAPINTACLGAAGAFFVSIFTNFRGAAELGIIASGGLLLCLSTGYVILPALLTLFPSKIPPIDEDKASERPAINLESNRSYHWWLALPALWAALLLAGVPFARRAHFDPSLLNMQAQNLESVKLVRKLQTWFAVVLSKDLEELRKARSVIQPLSTVTGTESILTAYDNYAWLKQHESELPTINWREPEAIAEADLSRIAAKARALADRLKTTATSTTQPQSFTAAAQSLESFAASLEGAAATTTTAPAASLTLQPTAATEIASQLNQWEKVFVTHLQGLLAPFHPSPLDIAKLPPTLHDHLIGTDGRFALYIYPKNDLWIQSALADFVHEVEHAMTSIAPAPPVTGIAINVYHSTSSIEKSFYHATGYALALIFVLVLIDLKNIPQTLLAISVLAMGLPMLVALMGFFDITWNFANFFGLPILIGAGHEYGVFMVHRYNEACRDPRRAWKRWDVSDRALLLCGFVTSASFGFFWRSVITKGSKASAWSWLWALPAFTSPPSACCAPPPLEARPFPDQTRNLRPRSHFPVIIRSIEYRCVKTFPAAQSPDKAHLKCGLPASNP